MSPNISMRAVIIFLIVGLAGGLSVRVNAQCEPDTVNCIDVGEPGQICPDSLPIGILGEPYNEVITIIAPDTVRIEGLEVILYKIEIDTVMNLPPGINYEANATEFFPDSVYCILLSGTPTDTGTYYLSISVIPYVKISNNVYALDVQTDDSTIFIRIESASSVSDLIHEDFSLIPGYPNPFITTTQIGFNTTTSGEVELVIYNLIGRQVYHERILANPGKNNFSFTGENISSGIYLYTVRRGGKVLTAKLVKAR